MSLNEADTRAQRIDPQLATLGWVGDLTKREVSAPAIDIVNGKGKRKEKGRADYLLRVKPYPNAYPVAIAVIEAKAEHLPLAEGLEQAKCYADSRRLNVPFVFASNGHLFVEFEKVTDYNKVMSEIKGVHKDFSATT